jgi:hypothetical protein
MALIQIDVRHDDITHGVGCDSSACMVTRAIYRHLNPLSRAFTQYATVTFKRYRSLDFADRDYAHEEATVLTLPTYAQAVDPETPNSPPVLPVEVFGLDLYGTEEWRSIESRIRQFDVWQDDVHHQGTRPPGVPPVPRPKPFSFVLDIPEKYLSTRARNKALKALKANKATTPDPDNSPSDLKAPKGTELFPARA